MMIFFGASSGKDFGNVIVKSPFSKVALTCSACANDSRQFIRSRRFKKNNIPVHLEVAEGYVRTCHENVRSGYVRCRHWHVQTSY
jgi:hypothetical protein